MTQSRAAHDHAGPDGFDLPTTAALKVAIVSDYEIVVRGMVDVLAASHLDVVLLDQDLLEQADVILFDTLGATGGWDRVGDLLATDTPVVIFSWQPPSSRYVDLIDAGLFGYLPMSARASEVVAALQTLAAGGTMHPRQDTLATPAAWPGQEHGLTAREGEVVALIMRGLSNEEIAGVVFLSVNTVKSHIRTAYRKMGTATRAEAISWGFARGLAPVPDTDHWGT